MQRSFLQNARYWLVLVLVAVITISYHPIIVNMTRAAGVTNGSILTKYVYALFGLLFILCLNVRSILKPKLIRVCLIIYIIIAFYYLITFSFFVKQTMMSDLRAIGMCLIAIMIGWQLSLNDKELRFLLLFFAGMTLFIGLTQVLTYIGGFKILDQYVVDCKNRLAVLLATGFTIFIFLATKRTNKGWESVLLYVSSALTFVVLLTIRARSATLSVVLIFMYILYERNKGKSFVIFMFFALLIVGVVLIALPSSVYDFVYNSFFQNYEDSDVTTGRLDRNAAALEFISMSPWIGNLNTHANLSQIHNFVLNRTYEFGILFVFPILVMYFYLLVVSITKTVKSDTNNINSIGYYLLLIPYIISMAEPTLPFGPGTVTVFNFILFGMSLRNTEESQQKQLMYQ